MPLLKSGLLYKHRIGLHPVNRMVWTRVGSQPIAQVNWKFEWLWLVGFVHPMSDETKGVDCTFTELESFQPPGAQTLLVTLA